MVCNWFRALVRPPAWTWPGTHQVPRAGTHQVPRARARAGTHQVSRARARKLKGLVLPRGLVLVGVKAECW